MIPAKSVSEVSALARRSSSLARVVARVCQRIPANYVLQGEYYLKVVGMQGLRGLYMYITEIKFT